MTRDLILIAALAENGIIGKDNKIPWRISDDMKHFKDLTMGHPVIMGKQTYLSIPEEFRPFEGRKNIVMSHNYNSDENIYIARSMKEALELTEGKTSYVAGGAQIYDLFLPLANKMELTRIHKNYEGDTLFPKINWNNWELVNQEDNETIKGTKYSFQTFIRK